MFAVDAEWHTPCANQKQLSAFPPLNQFNMSNIRSKNNEDMPDFDEMGAKFRGNSEKDAEILWSIAPELKS